MQPPSTVKEVQRLAGRVVALCRFVPKSGNKCSEFFKILKNPDNFQWTEQCQLAFEDLKKFLTSTPVLSSPTPSEDLYLYLAISENAISMVLARAEGRQHRPVYYINHVFQGAQLRYSRLEKFAYAIVLSARRLRPYFEAHPITVLTDMPLRSTLQKPDSSGRMMKYAIELSAFGVQFQPPRCHEGPVPRRFCQRVHWTPRQG